MRFKAYALIAWCLLLWGTATAQEVSLKAIRSHINFLCSDALEGRLTGSSGEKMATQYIADFFQQLKLEPAGDNGTYFQYFDFVAGVTLGNNNQLSITDKNNLTKQLVLHQDWRPLAYSANQSFNNVELVVVGYGITAPTYDSYRNLNVKNKWVIVQRHVPVNVPIRYSSLRYKVFTAKKNGATGVIFVNETQDGNKLVPFAIDTALSSSGIVVLSLRDSRLLKNAKISGQTEINKNIQHGRNVLAKLQVDASKQPMIVVGAHVDHLGRGKLGGSRGVGKEIGMIHSGADDNASGVASMLETARILTDLAVRHKLSGNKDILFAAWSGEEFGILGSSHFVNHYNDISQPKITAAINLDMVGHLRQSLVLQGVGSGTEWPMIIRRMQANHSINLIKQNDPYLPTDSTAFYLHNIPTLNLFTGAHQDYHTPRDMPSSLNYAGIKQVSQFLINLIVIMQDRSQTISYREMQKSSKIAKREMKIYLGTIPDYSADVAGVKIAGVAKHSPAEQAGLRADDVIVELAGKSIHDIYDYTFALNGLSVGKAVPLMVLRGRVTVKLIIVARYRDA